MVARRGGDGVSNNKCKPDCELDANMRLFFDVDSPDFNHAFCPKCDKKEVKKND